MIGLHGLIVWWIAQVPLLEHGPEWDNTNRAGIYDLVVTFVSAPDLTRQQ